MNFRLFIFDATETILSLLSLCFQPVHKTHNVLLHLIIECIKFLVRQPMIHFVFGQLFGHKSSKHLALPVEPLYKQRVIKNSWRKFGLLLSDIVTESCAVYFIGTVFPWTPFGIFNLTLILKMRSGEPKQKILKKSTRRNWQRISLSIHLYWRLQYRKIWSTSINSRQGTVSSSKECRTKSSAVERRTLSPVTNRTSFCKR